MNQGDPDNKFVKLILTNGSICDDKSTLVNRKEFGRNSQLSIIANDTKSLILAEVQQKPMSVSSSVTLEKHVRQFLQFLPNVTAGDVFGCKDFNSNKFLIENVVDINMSLSEWKLHQQSTKTEGDDLLEVNVFKLYSDEAEVEEIDENTAAAQYWRLPHSSFHQLWDSLVFDTNIKEQLLSYSSSSILFAKLGVNANVISSNRIILLHGPPGTGKTSLCKALAQKLSMRLASEYSNCLLMEINSHSLFSKWFSESGKLVVKMFSKIHEIVEDSESLVFILIDEVESLAAARNSATAGTDPSDAIRVVNALLTQIDQLRHCPNVFILTTSNITKAIDIAFVDRADIQQYIGLPSWQACYQIYLSCINELFRTTVVCPAVSLLTLKELESWNQVNGDLSEKFRKTLDVNEAKSDVLDEQCSNDVLDFSIFLMNLAKKSEGLSGRTLRKIPFLTHALYVQVSSSTLQNFLLAMESAIVKQKQDQAHFQELKK